MELRRANDLTSIVTMWSVAGHFVRAHPPSSPLMMFYGSEFPVFLEGFEPAKQLPYLPDMARLEHARRLAFHAADDPILTPDALSTVAPEKLGGVRHGGQISGREQAGGCVDCSASGSSEYADSSTRWCSLLECVEGRADFGRGLRERHTIEPRIRSWPEYWRFIIGPNYLRPPRAIRKGNSMQFIYRLEESILGPISRLIDGAVIKADGGGRV